MADRKRRRPAPEIEPRPRFAGDRRRRVLELVRNSGAVSLREIASTVGASEVTIRRDLRQLQSEGLLQRQRGGATSADLLSHELTFAEKAQQQGPQKAAIAKIAATLVEPGDSVAVGPGTTTNEFARQLVGIADLTVITNSLRVVGPLAQAGAADVIVTGGALRHATFSLIGAPMERSLSGLMVRRVFLSGNGLSVQRGLSTTNVQVAAADRAIAETGQEVVVLADHTKLGLEAMAQTVPIERVTYLCVDSGADPSILAEFRALGVTVLVAEVEESDSGG